MEKVIGKIILKKGREKPVHNRHPWVFSGAINHVEGHSEGGDLVAIHDHKDQFLAVGYFNPKSQIRARILSWNEDQIIGESFWQTLIQRAIDSRSALNLESQTNAYRLINAESDNLPGLIVDRYANFLVMQCLTLGIDIRKSVISQILNDLIQPTGIFERSDSNIRKKEGLALHNGSLLGHSPDGEIIIHENELNYLVDIKEGHKTGFYLDQRSNRSIIQNLRLTVDQKVLNVFAYTGGFSLAVASAGAGPITNVDSSIPALELAERNMALNNLTRPGDEFLAGDAFEVLRHFQQTNNHYDLVILDPPKFAHSRRDLEKASRGYKDINRLALQIIEPGGLLMTFSCSGQVSEDLFQKILFSATLEANRQVQIIQRLGQSPDHPVSLTFPESAYLKGFLCRVW